VELSKIQANYFADMSSIFNDFRIRFEHAYVEASLTSAPKEFIVSNL